MVVTALVNHSSLYSIIHWSGDHLCSCSSVSYTEYTVQTTRPLISNTEYTVQTTRSLNNLYRTYIDYWLNFITRSIQNAGKSILLFHHEGGPLLHIGYSNLSPVSQFQVSKLYQSILSRFRAHYCISFFQKRYYHISLFTPYMALSWHIKYT